MIEVPIIFLDFDGVLNDSTWFKTERPKQQDDLDPSRIAKLNYLIEKTSSQVVISSSWRTVFKRPRLIKFLEEKGFKGKIIGQTPEMPGMPRCMEIDHWLQNHPEVKNYVILDDDPDAGIDFEARYVSIPDGIEDIHVSQACQILGVPLNV